MIGTDIDLDAKTLAGGQVVPLGERAWRLSIPEGPAGEYRLAQLDDYTGLPRSQFPWNPPLQISLRARASHDHLPGTWGFGLWNDPFAADLGFAGGARRFPVLPDTAWFFFASPENHLTLNDDLPASGELAATFQSKKIPSILLALIIPLAPLIFLGPAARLLRRAGQRIIRQDAEILQQALQDSPSENTEWSDYALYLDGREASFQMNGETVLHTDVIPQGPLGLVIWIDNQYAALPPGGGIAFGTLANPEPAWIEIADLTFGSI